MDGVSEEEITAAVRVVRDARRGSPYAVLRTDRTAAQVMAGDRAAEVAADAEADARLRGLVRLVLVAAREARQEGAA